MNRSAQWNVGKTVPLLVTVATYVALYLGFAYLVAQKPINVGNFDYWMHAGSVAIFSEDLISPEHSYDEPDALRVRNFSPYQFVLASLVRGLDITPVDAMVIGSLLSIGLIFAGLSLVATRFGDNPWLPFGLLIGVLFFVGSGFSWSTEVDATVLPIVAGYPSTVSTGLALICWYAADLMLERFTWPRFAVVALLVALIFLIHQFVFLFLMVILFFWALPIAGNWKEKLLLGGAILTGLVLTLAWPYFNPFNIALGAALGWHGESRPDGFLVTRPGVPTFEQPFLVLENLGPALLSIPLLAVLDQRLRWRLGPLLIVSTLIWWAPILGFKGVPTSGYRWGMLSLLSMQLICGAAIAVLLLRSALPPESGAQQRRTLYNLSIAMITGILVWQAGTLWGKYGKYVWPRYNKTASETRKLEWFVEELKTLNIGNQPIVAEPWYSYALPTFQLKSVNFGRKVSPVADRLFELYADDTPLQRRRELIKGFNTPYFLLRGEERSPSWVRDFDEMGELLVERGGIRLYRLKNHLNANSD